MKPLSIECPNLTCIINQSQLECYINKHTRTRNWGPQITSMRPFSDLSLLSSFHVPFCDHDPHLAPFSAEKNAFFCDFLAINSDVSAALKRTSFQLFRQRGRKTIFWQFPNKHNIVEIKVDFSIRIIFQLNLSRYSPLISVEGCLKRYPGGSSPLCPLLAWH